MAPVKIRIPLPPGDPSGGEAEWLWAEPVGGDRFALDNVPTFVYGLSCGDVVTARRVDGNMVFDQVVERGGHSTYRLYLKSDPSDPKVVKLLGRLEEMHCDIEVATEKIISVDVLPEAAIYGVYQVLEDAERAGILEFEEGHCGHVLKQE